MARGWKKFALPETVGRAELPPVAVETMGSGLDNADNFSLPGKKKFSTNVQFDSARPLATPPQTLAGEEAISVDVAGSYLLTHIGRAHVRPPDTTAHHVSRPLTE